MDRQYNSRGEQVLKLQINNPPIYTVNQYSRSLLFRQVIELGVSDELSIWIIVVFPRGLDVLTLSLSLSL